MICAKMVWPWFTASLLEGYPRCVAAQKTREIIQIVEAHFGLFLSRYHTVTAIFKMFNRTVVI